MATKLNKPLIRETGLKSGKKPVYVTLIPTKDGGAIVLKEKGSRGKGKTIPLKDLLKPSLPQSEPKRKPVIFECDDWHTADMVDLSTLEARIMIEAPDLAQNVKGKLWSIVREMREERREDFGLPSVRSGAK